MRVDTTVESAESAEQAVRDRIREFMTGYAALCADHGLSLEPVKGTGLGIYESDGRPVVIGVYTDWEQDGSQVKVEAPGLVRARGFNRAGIGV